MYRIVKPSALAAVLALVWLSSMTVLSGAQRAAGTPSISPSIWNGIFTDAQVDRGLAAYERSCAKCHQADLRGDQVSEAPPLVGEPFLEHWDGQPVKDLFDKIRTKMPADNPGSLSAARALDIVAYLLKSNRFPSGTAELAVGGEALTRPITAAR